MSKPTHYLIERSWWLHELLRMRVKARIHGLPKGKDKERCEAQRELVKLREWKYGRARAGKGQ